jgi:hypothetical protein
MTFLRPHVFYLLVYGTADLEFWDIRIKFKLRFQNKDFFSPTILFFIFFQQPDHHFLVADPVNHQIKNMWPYHNPSHLQAIKTLPLKAIPSDISRSYF